MSGGTLTELILNDDINTLSEILLHAFFTLC